MDAWASGLGATRHPSPRPGIWHVEHASSKPSPRISSVYAPPNRGRALASTTSPCFPTPSPSTPLHLSTPPLAASPSFVPSPNGSASRKPHAVTSPPPRAFPPGLPVLKGETPASSPLNSTFHRPPRSTASPSIATSTDTVSAPPSCVTPNPFFKPTPCDSSRSKPWARQSPTRDTPSHSASISTSASRPSKNYRACGLACHVSSSSRNLDAPALDRAKAHHRPLAASITVLHRPSGLFVHLPIWPVDPPLPRNRPPPHPYRRHTMPRSAYPQGWGDGDQR